MTRFYFHVTNSVGRVEDLEGDELAGLAEARAHAVEGIRSILSEEARSGRIDLRGFIEIADETGAVLSVVGFREAFVIDPGDDGP